MQNFRLPTVQVKFHQNCTLIGYFFLKVYKVSAKKSKEELCFIIAKSGAKFEEKLNFCFKNDKNLTNFHQNT